MKDNERKPKPDPESKYQNLQQHQIEMIDHAISTVGDFGEVHLIVEKGQLRFLVTQKSFDVHKWNLQS